MLNTMTDTPFSISTKASSYGCIWIQSPHTIDFRIDPDIREILGLEGFTVILSASFYGSNVIDVTQNRQVIQVYLSLACSLDLKIANQNSNLLTTMITDETTTCYCRSVEELCIPMITRFDRLMFVFRDMEGMIMRLNGLFELLLTIENWIKGEGKCNPSLMSVYQSSVIEVLGNTTMKEVTLGNPLFHSIIVLSRPCRSIPIMYCTTSQPTK